MRIADFSRRICVRLMRDVNNIFFFGSWCLLFRWNRSKSLILTVFTICEFSKVQSLIYLFAVMQGERRFIDSVKDFSRFQELLYTTKAFSLRFCFHSVILRIIVSILSINIREAHDIYGKSRCKIKKMKTEELKRTINRTTKCF